MPSQSTYNSNLFSSQISPKNTPVFQPASSGKEKDSETGYYYFGARYYNPDLSLWLSVDPMSDKYPTLSPYNYCAWNPMKIVDPNGDTLDIRGGARARADILSVVSPAFKERVSFSNDRVSVDAEGLSNEEIELDAGFSVLYRMTTSNNRYLYQAEEVLDKEGDPIPLWNNSITPHSELRKSGDPLPDGYQGWIVLHPNTVFMGFDNEEYVSNRPSTVFHELEENYQRTDLKHPHTYHNRTDWSKADVTRPGAHEIAVQKAARLTPSARSVFGKEGTARKCLIIK